MLLTVTHRFDPTQEMSFSCPLFGDSVVHVGLLLARFELLRMSPLEVVAAQLPTDGQLSEVIPDAGMEASDNHAVMPPVGSSLIKTLPEESVATHHLIDAQLTPVNWPPTSISVRVHSPVVGDVVVRTSPPSSTLTHNVDDGQEIPASWSLAPSGKVLPTKSPALQVRGELDAEVEIVLTGPMSVVATKMLAIMASQGINARFPVFATSCMDLRSI